jgi:hypothetical protein
MLWPSWGGAQSMVVRFGLDETCAARAGIFSWAQCGSSRVSGNGSSLFLRPFFVDSRKTEFTVCKM